MVFIHLHPLLIRRNIYFHADVFISKPNPMVWPSETNPMIVTSRGSVEKGES